MEKLTRTDFNNAISTINRYYRQITGKKECVNFYVDYIQPLQNHINECENKIELKK